jgi:acyl carrier protein
MSTISTIQDLLVKKFGLDRSTILPESTLADLGLDSLSVAELVFDLEDAFRVTLSTTLQAETIAELAVFIDRLRTTLPDPAANLPLSSSVGRT